MATNKQREASRRQLEQQLRERQAREARRKRTTLIGSVVGTLVLIAVVVIVIAATAGDDGKKKPAAGPKNGSHNTQAATSSAPAPCGQAQLPPVPAKPATGPAVTFDGVTVKGAADLGGKPVVSSHGTAAATELAVKDLVVGKGAAATPSSCVNVQYDGVLYTTGKEFDSSWSHGSPAQFSLTGVVEGFTDGIGGTQTVGSHKGISPMRVGGRRIIIVPAAQGYGDQASGSIPANSDLVFVVDLLKVAAS